MWVALAVSLWLALAGNVPLWRALLSLPQYTFSQVLWMGAALAGMIAALCMALLAPLAWRGTLKPAATVLLLMAGATTHFMLLYHVVIDADMMANTLQTDVRETRDLLNARLWLTLGLVTLLPAVLLWRTPLARSRWSKALLQNALAAAAALLVCAGVTLSGYQALSSLMRNHHALRYMANPLNTVYALINLGVLRKLQRPHVFEDIGQDARLAPAPAGAKPPLLVLVVGETGRAGNFALNGYARPTNPLLATEDVASFRNAWSCGTSTATALPCMFSHLGKQGFESRDRDYANLVDVLHHAGLAMLWVDNQPAFCKGLCDRIDSAATFGLKDPVLCADGDCQDQILLKNLDERLQALPLQRRAQGAVIVLHQIGSHGPAYWRRSDAAHKPFLPECSSNVLQDCPREQLLNAYDNSIVYTDQFLHDTIGWLKTHAQQYDTALIYMSDHGESLGENGLYLHGLPYAIAPDVQKHVPLIVWQSQAMQRRSQASTACLRARRDEHLTQDHLFHSVLGLLHVRTSLYNPALDWFAPCRGPAAQ